METQLNKPEAIKNEQNTCSNGRQCSKCAKIIIIILILIVLGFGIYYFFFKKPAKIVQPENQQNIWYAVRLDNNEIYYGLIANINSDPILIKNAYYNEAATSSKSNTLVLIKRGSEPHQPDGSMYFFKDDIVYIEPLSANSPVLNKIINN